MPMFRATKNHIVWKKAWRKNRGRLSPVIIKLRLKKGTLYYTDSDVRVPDLRKCRAQRLTPIRFYSMKGVELNKKTTVISIWDSNFEYKIGKVAEPSCGFDMNHTACSSGIHFYFKQKRAEEH